MTESNKKVIYWLRWILFIPIAFLLSRCVYWIGNFIEKTVAHHSNYIIRLPSLILVFSTFILVATAKFIIPSHKKISGLIIVIFFSVLILITLLIIGDSYLNNNISAMDYFTIRDSIIMLILVILTNIFYKGEKYLGLSSNYFE